MEAGIDPHLDEHVIEVVSTAGVVRGASMRNAQQTQVVRQLVDSLRPVHGVLS